MGICPSSFIDSYIEIQQDSQRNSKEITTPPGKTNGGRVEKAYVVV
jgi:hypothetical protein